MESSATSDQLPHSSQHPHHAHIELVGRGIEFEEYDTETFKTVDHIVTSAGIGRSAWFKDPDGNTIAVFQPE